MRALVVFAIMFAAMPASAFEGHFEGQASFVVGNRYCPVQGPALKFEVKNDGSVVGGVRTQSKAAAFNGTVGPDGKLSATYKAATDSDVVTIEATLSDKHLEGFTQSASCKYKISFDRN
ncbi:MAG TPA: hypothetical protein VKQ70_06935 [Caulobacteraceae bacterium]|nr:hypothetical protein [Caulobacteraceae bacterium]